MGFNSASRLEKKQLVPTQLIEFNTSHLFIQGLYGLNSSNRNQLKKSLKEKSITSPTFSLWILLCWAWTSLYWISLYLYFLGLHLSVGIIW